MEKKKNRVISRMNAVKSNRAWLSDEYWANVSSVYESVFSLYEKEY